MVWYGMVKLYLIARGGGGGRQNVNYLQEKKEIFTL